MSRRKKSTSRLILLILLNLILTVLTGGIWLIAVILWFILKD